MRASERSIGMRVPEWNLGNEGLGMESREWSTVIMRCRWMIPLWGRERIENIKPYFLLPLVSSNPLYTQFHSFHSAHGAGGTIDNPSAISHMCQTVSGGAWLDSIGNHWLFSGVGFSHTILWSALLGVC